MKNLLLTFLFSLITFASLAQNYVGVTVGNVKSGASSKKYTSTIDGSDRWVFSSTGVTPEYRFTDLSGTGNRILAVDADGDLVRTGVDPSSSVPGGNSLDFQYNNGGVFGGYSPSAARTALGGTTIGQAVFLSTNPSAITFGRANADNTFSWLSASDFRTAIGVPSGSSTANYVAYWSGTNTLTGASTFQHDGSGNVDITGSLDVDNINVNGNTISTTNVNGSLDFDTNGSGQTRVLTSDGNILMLTGGVSEGSSTLRIDGRSTVSGGAGLNLIAGTEDDLSAGVPITQFTSLIDGVGTVTTRKLFGWYNNTTKVMEMPVSGGLSIFATTNQLVTGSGANLTTLNFPASSGAATLTFPNTTTTVAGYISTSFTPVVSDATSGGNTATGTFEGHYVVQNGLATVYISLVNITTAGMTGGNDLFIQLPALLTPITSAGLYNGTCRSGGSNTFAGYLTAGFLTLTNSLVIRENVSGAINDQLTVAEISSGAGDLFITIQFMVN